MPKDKVTVVGRDLVETVKRLISRGDSRRVCLIHEEKRLLDIPVGDPSSPATVLAAPVLAALNGVLVLMAHPVRRRMVAVEMETMFDDTLDLLLRGLERRK